ncbi:copper homeostasis membrane protein CopD [Variovorax dokdonensis]|uniref:Copper homeostasis membrane protein CopD n=1 Tax=Variovorax dokdonensis TaxID=344883 RepID=A0ABT7N745_9BURK|nr:copper homeostasis membrane protein CopD [Variovorax dokdonensis]
MEDWITISLRFALYLALAATFGIALFGVYAFRMESRWVSVAPRFARAATLGALLAMLLSIGALVALAKTLVGVETFGELNDQVFRTILFQTPVGASWLVRLSALAAFVGIGLLSVSLKGRLTVMSGLGAVALATLAWSGHGAMSEGMQGNLHLIADVVHLLAAGAWVGALFAFVMLAGPRRATPQSVEVLRTLSKGFSSVGTTIVVALVVTGVLNYLAIVGANVEPIFNTRYGALLGLKLVLFAGMVVLAAANRFALTPQLELALTTGKHLRAFKMLRRSLFVEAGLSTLVIACVAWLGVLSPGR